MPTLIFSPCVDKALHFLRSLFLLEFILRLFTLLFKLLFKDFAYLDKAPTIDCWSLLGKQTWPGMSGTWSGRVWDPVLDAFWVRLGFWRHSLGSICGSAWVGIAVLAGADCGQY